MWYTGKDSGSSNYNHIFYATSSDGISWTREGEVLAPDGSDGIPEDNYGLEKPIVLKEGTTYHMCSRHLSYRTRTCNEI